MIPEPKKATDHPSRDGLVMGAGQTISVLIVEEFKHRLLHGNPPSSAHRLDVAPTRAQRSPEQAAERIAKAEAKRARKWGAK